MGVVTQIKDLDNTPKNVRMVAPVYDSFENLIVKRNCVGVPRDLMRVPQDRRNHAFDRALMWRVFSASDGKKSLKDAVKQAEWEGKSAKTEEQLSAFLKALELCAEFGYIKLEKK